MSQIIFAAIFVGDANECAKSPSDQSKKMIKHSIINSIRANYVAQKKHYGSMVLACDNGSWRNDIFSQYKYSRREKRKQDNSGIKWNFVNEVKNELVDDLNDKFPFVVINLPKTEGDDIGAVLSKHITDNSSLESELDIFGDSTVENILIQSSDADNYQLHMLGKHIKQWSPMLKKMVGPVGSARNALIEKIVKGDSGDGIPNIKMDSNTFVDKIRQKPISQKYLDSFYTSSNPIEMCEDEEQRINYIRNEQLISYEKIPLHISEAIILCYNQQLVKKHSKMSLMNYFINNDMTNLLGQIHDFY